MTTIVSRVACMRLLGGVQVTRKPARGVIRLPPPTLLGATSSFAMPPPNAAHHPPRSPLVVDDSRRVRGRVHALVRFCPSLAHLPPPGAAEVTPNPRHALRYPLLPRSGQTRWPAELQSERSATRYARAFNPQRADIATRI